MLLAFASGAAALAHQVFWTRSLVDLLGASGGTFARVVGAFFVGLALGAWAGSRPIAGRRRVWRRVAGAEAAVALLALPPLFASSLGERLQSLPALLAVAKFAGPLLLVTPAAFAMGLVIPWMIRAVASGVEAPPRLPVWLYAVNTLGGVAGLALALLVALPQLGLTRAGLCVSGVNLLVAVVAWALQPRLCLHLAGHPDHHLTAPLPPARHQFLAFASGALVLALEVVLQHQLAQVTINSFFSGALVLALVLLALGAAALAAPFLGDRLGINRAVPTVILLASLAVAAQPFLFIAMREGLTILPYDLCPWPYTMAVLQLGLVTIVPSVFTAGLVFPLLLRAAAPQGDEGNARRIGRLLAWNGLGGWLGSEGAQWFLVPRYGLWLSLLMLAAAYLLARVALLVNEVDEAGRMAPRRLSLAIGVGATVLVLGWLVRTLPQVSLKQGEKLIALGAGREGVVATVEIGPGDQRMLFNNSYTLGGSKAQFNQERQAHLPLLLHGRARSVAVLGVATGSTVAGATLHPELERVDAIELSPLVLHQAAQFFRPSTRDVFRDDRVRFVAEDARWVIAQQPAAYDVVIGDLFLPWRTGEGRLYSREHFEAVRRSLKPGGLFCQWLPLFQLTRGQFETIARTFRQVFPETTLVRGDFYTEQPIVGLVGGHRLAAQDWARTAEACAGLRAAGRVTDPLARHAGGVAMLVIGPLPDLGRGPVNTLGNAWLEWDAGRNILGLRSPWFIGVPCAEFIREVHQAGAEALPAELRPAHEAGQFFLTLEIAAKINDPALGQLQAQIPERLPANLRADRTAEWQHWPARIKPGLEDAPR
jgi:spermidine synthase